MSRNISLTNQINNAKSYDNIKDFSKNNLNENNLSKNNNKLIFPTIATRNKVLTEIYRNKNLHGPLFFYSEEQKEREMNKKFLSPKRNKFSQLKMRRNYNENLFKEINEYNVFNTEDNQMKNLMIQFKERYNKLKVDKLKRRKIVLNKLYDLPPEFDDIIKKAKKFKTLDLENYQGKILTAMPVESIGKVEIMNLVSKLNVLKSECDSVKPLPPINIKIIEDHVYNKNKEEIKNVKKMKLKEFLKQTNEPKDEFEKEEKLIKNIRSYKVLPKFKRNKNYDFLPGYLRESLNKNLKFHL